MFNGEIRPKCGCPQHHQKHSISAQILHVKCEVQWWRADDSDLFCSQWTRVPYSYGINHALLSIPNFSLKCETICPIDKTESCNKKVIPSNSKSTNEWLKKKRIKVSQSRPQPTWKCCGRTSKEHEWNLIELSNTVKKSQNSSTTMGETDEVIRETITLRYWC